jgi:hypothetical protein
MPYSVAGWLVVVAMKSDQVRYDAMGKYDEMGRNDAMGRYDETGRCEEIGSFWQGFRD